MFEKATLMWIYAENPVHAGAGSGVGAIDLPVQRERITNWPIIQPSGIKGALREFFEILERGGGREDAAFKEKIKEAFGPELQPGTEAHSGALAFTEARLLFFPVRSLQGTFAYLTCPLALERLRRDLETVAACGGPSLAASLPSLSNGGPSADRAWVAEASSLSIAPGNGSRVVFEEMAFQAEAREEVSKLGGWVEKQAAKLPWLGRLAERVALVHDDVFKDFVEMSTEVVARNRIDDETGTVQEGALWYEEHLPRETVLYSAIFAAAPFVKATNRKLADAGAVIEFFRSRTDGKHVWVGGDVTVGRGLVRTGFPPEAAGKGGKKS